MNNHTTLREPTHIGSFRGSSRPDADAIYLHIAIVSNVDSCNPPGVRGKFNQDLRRMLPISRPTSLVANAPLVAFTAAFVV